MQTLLLSRAVHRTQQRYAAAAAINNNKLIYTLQLLKVVCVISLEK